MKRLLPLALLALFPVLANAQQQPPVQPYRTITSPTIAELSASFGKPPKVYSAIHWAIWGGPQTKERVMSDIDKIAANGGGVYMINNSQRVAPKYLSPEYLDIVKSAVSEAKKNGMHVWIETDCGYPDGFAGGAISKDYPMLGMQGIITDCHCTVAAGATLDIPLPPDTLGIIASPGGAAAGGPAGTAMPIPADKVFKYTPPRRGAGTISVELANNVVIRYNVSPGEPFTIPVPDGTKSISLGGGGGGGGGARGGRGGGGGGGTIIPLPANGQLKWTAPAGAGSYDVAFIRRVYRSSPTRNDNGEDGGATKDGFYTLIDYLDPLATKTFIKCVHENYATAVGDEFGKTVLGFRGDETDYSGVTPMTSKLLETFKAMKGYDFQPYIPQIFGGRSSPEAVRAKADYWDVWSAMFRDNFYKVQEDWCNARGMEYMMHLNHEESQVACCTSEGSFERSMRYVGVPGIDNLSQIKPGTVADFPKLAASTAHMYGRPQSWAEEGGGPGAGKFVADYQLVRGINFMNIQGMTGAGAGNIGWYVSRSQWVLANGRPAAQVAYYHATDSIWLGDTEADRVCVSLANELLQHQIDFDHIDHDSLVSVCTLEGGGLKNLSGQVYKAVIIPSCTVIQKDMLDRLRDFAKGGGKVVFVGRTPTMVADKTFLNATGAPDLSFATLVEPTAQITDRVVAALPKPDVKLDTACTAIKYTHRVMKDGDAYFFFNESAQAQTRTATLDGTGQVQVWDANTGKIQPLAGAPKADGSVAVPLVLGPQEAKIIVIGPLPTTAG